VHLLHDKPRIVVPKYLDVEENEFETKLLFYGTKWAVLVISYRGVNRLYFLFQKVADTRNSIQWRAIERKTVGGNLKISANRTVNNIVCYPEVTNRGTW
jgi:hypothetical protein